MVATKSQIGKLVLITFLWLCLLRCDSVILSRHIAVVVRRMEALGFERLTGRKPQPDDPIVPSRRGAYRNVNASLRRSTRTWSASACECGACSSSIARADVAVVDTLRFVTHDPDDDTMDNYTTLPWPALCAEVAKAGSASARGKLFYTDHAGLCATGVPVRPG